MSIIFKRTSIRSFTDKKVEEEKIMTILKAAMAAPTAGNQREWEFIVVSDLDLLKALSQVSPYAGPAANATIAIVPVVDKTNMRYPDYWEQDLGATCENILLEAVELGLGAVWLGIAPVEERIKKVTEILNLPEHVVPFAIIPIGYAKKEVEPKKSFDKTKIHYNQYKGKLVKDSIEQL